jgi:hypothetical protein
MNNATCALEVVGIIGAILFGLLTGGVGVIIEIIVMAIIIGCLGNDEKK